MFPMKKSLTLVLFLFIFTACFDNLFELKYPKVDIEKPSKPEDYGEFELQENVIFISEAYEDFIVEVIDSTGIILLNEIDSALYPEVGDVVYCVVTKNSPYGFAGRVVSSEVDGKETRFITEGVDITDVFKELHLSMPIDFPDDVSYFVDEKGEKVKCRMVSNDIWDSIESSGVSVDTKLQYATGISHTFELGVHDNDIYDGNFYIGLAASVTVDLSDGKLEKLMFTTEKRCGIVGALKCSKNNTAADKNKMKFLDKTIVLPYSIVVGPLILTPDLHLESGVFFTKEATLQGDISFELEHTRCEFGYENGEPTYKTYNLATKDNRIFALLKFEAKGEAGIYAETALELALYTRRMLALGASAQASFGLSAEGEISFGNKELLQINPKITVGPELKLGVYCFSELLKTAGNETKLDFFTTHKLAEFELPIFPKFTSFVTEKANGVFSARAQVDETNLIKTEEEGFALFKKSDTSTPVIHKPADIHATKASSQYSVSFNVNDPNDYTVMAYVKADGKYWYLAKEWPTPGQWVDLGLPSGIKWAGWNVGASSPEEYGDYYAWGDTQDKEEFCYATYLHTLGGNHSDHRGHDCSCWLNYQRVGNVTGFDDERCISGTSYDVAHVKWGDGARMPTREDSDELLYECEFTDEVYRDVRGVLCQGPNGNSIFIPYAGIVECQTLYGDNSEAFPNTLFAHLWTSESWFRDTAFILEFKLIPIGQNVYGLYNSLVHNRSPVYGRSVRPVKD